MLRSDNLGDTTAYGSNIAKIQIYKKIVGLKEYPSIKDHIFFLCFSSDYRRLKKKVACFFIKMSMAVIFEKFASICLQLLLFYISAMLIKLCLITFADRSYYNKDRKF